MLRLGEVKLDPDIFYLIKNPRCTRCEFFCSICVLGTYWFLTRMDRNCMGVYENGGKIPLIQVSHPP